MSEENRKLIEETVENLKHLDKASLMVIKSGAEMLKSRDFLEKTAREEYELEPSHSKKAG